MMGTLRKWGKWPAALILLMALLLTRNGLRDTYHHEVEPIQMGDTMAMMVSDVGEGKPSGVEIGSGSLPMALPSRAQTGSAAQDLGESFGEGFEREHRPGFSHDDDHDHAHEAEGPGHGHEEPAQGISNGMVLLLKHLGLQELAANLLWIQMDADSHHELWHRVEFALRLIPTIDPHFVEAFLLHSYFLDDQGRFKESLEILENGLRNNPNRSDLWVQVGLLSFNMNHRHGPDRDLEKALAAFTQATRMADCPTYLFRFRAIALVGLHRRDEAIAYLEDLEKQPNRPDSDRAQDARLLKRIRAGENWD